MRYKMETRSDGEKQIEEERRRGEKTGGKGRFAAADGATTTAKIARFDAPRRFDEEHGKRVFRAKHMQG